MDFVMDGFYGYSLAEFPQTDKSVVQLAQSFWTKGEVQDRHFRLSKTPGPVHRLPFRITIIGGDMVRIIQSHVFW